MEGTLTALGSELISQDAHKLFRRSHSRGIQSKSRLARKRNSDHLTCEELLEEFQQSHQEGDLAGGDESRDVLEETALAQCIALALLDSTEKSRYHAQQAGMGAHLDCFCYVLGGIAWVAAGFRLGPLPYVLGAVLFHLGAAYLSFQRLDMYMRYRTFILLATKISNAIVGNYQSPTWQGSPSTDWMTFIVGDLAIYSKLMGQVMVCFLVRLPFAYDAAAQVIFVACSLRQNWANCRGLEMRTSASRGKYELLANSLNQALHMLQAFPGVEHSEAPRILPGCACISVQAFIQMTGGLLLPLSLRYSWEARGRWLAAADQICPTMARHTGRIDDALLFISTLGLAFVVLWPLISAMACSTL